MSAPVVLPEGRLDFRAVTARLPDGSAPWRAVWSTTLAVTPGRSRLLNMDTALALVNAPSGIIALGDTPPAEERLLDGASIAARPGADGCALLIDDRGCLHRWAPGTAPQKVWETGAPGNQIEAIATAGGRLLVQRPRGGVALGAVFRMAGAGWTTELVEPGAGVSWTRAGDLRGAVPWEDALLVVPAARRTVARLDAASGSQRWERPLGGRVSTLVAIVARTLWLTTYEGEVVALDVETGAIGVRLRLPDIALPEGVVDADGRFHLCTGSTYIVLDLTKEGAVVASTHLPAATEPVSLVFGRAAIPTSDGRLVFADRNGRIFIARAGRSAAPTLLWRSSAPLLDCRAACGMLFVLDRDGGLRALLPRGAEC